MEARAIGKFERISPTKVRQVANKVKGKTVEEALLLLKFMNKKASEKLYRVTNSAAANLKNKNARLKDSEIKIVSISADGGPTIKRFKPRAMGRAGLIRKRTSHITVVVSD